MDHPRSVKLATMAFAATQTIERKRLPGPPLSRRTSADSHLAARRQAAMRHKLRTEAGHQVYRLPKMTVEPVIGIIKQAIGGRQFMHRRAGKVRGEWEMMCLGYTKAIAKPQDASTSLRTTGKARTFAKTPRQKCQAVQGPAKTAPAQPYLPIPLETLGPED